MTPKKRLIDFLKNSEMDKPYEFTIEGNEEEAHKYIQRMRVALSRFREEIINRNMKPKPFKMLVIKVEEFNSSSEEELHTMISLVRTQNKLKMVSSEVEDVFGSLAEQE